MFAALARLILKVCGWKEGKTPPLEVKQLVCIAAPHTSNWDYVWMMLYVQMWGMKIRWMGKQSLFEGPLGPLLKLTGGIGIDRSKANNTVDAMAAEFQTHDHLWLVIPAAGTRGRKDYWKSGFYAIAAAAGVPICPAVLDYDKREARFEPLIDSSGSVGEVMDTVREYYEPAGAKVPSKKSRIQLRGEEPPDEPAPVPVAVAESE
jgi:1-acyl-sn-glycerol-3-phosphate acyltransferase